MLSTREYRVLKKTRDALERNNLIIFAGSAISTYFPSCLISGQKFSETIPNLLFQGIPPLADKVREIPFEVLLCHGVSALGRDRIISFLQRIYGLENRSFNPVHRSLAELMTNARAVVTPNYDNFIEKALLGPSVTKTYDKAFSNLGAKRIFTAMPSSLPTDIADGKPILFKIHGSIEEPNSLVFDINQEGQLDEWKILTLKYLLKDAHVLFLAYSGTEWDILPTLKKFDLQQITWNAYTINDISEQALQFLSTRQADVIEGDMIPIIRFLNPRLENPEPCDPEVDLLSEAIKPIPLDMRRHWYAAILARCGYGKAAIPILRNLFDKSTVADKHSLRIHLAEAYFFSSKYRDCRRYADQAADNANNLSTYLEAKLIVANALRQEAKHLMQRKLLNSLEELALQPKYDQELGTILAYKAQNPFYLPKTQRKLINEAKKIRSAKPWSSMLILNSVIRTELNSRGSSKSKENHLDISKLESLNELRLQAHRLAHATEITNSYRDIAIEKLRLYSESTDEILLREASMNAKKSIEFANEAGEIAGLAKGYLVLAEIKRRLNKKSWYQDWKKSLENWLKIQLPTTRLAGRILRWHLSVLSVGKWLERTVIYLKKIS